MQRRCAQRHAAATEDEAAARARRGAAQAGDDEDADVRRERERADAPAAHDASVLMRRLCKSYADVSADATKPEFDAVAGVSARVDGGEVFGLLGANGAGKTSVLAMLSGRVLPSGGSIALSGTPPSATSAQRSIGIVTQSNELFDFLSCRCVVHSFV